MSDAEENSYENSKNQYKEDDDEPNCRHDGII